MPIKAGQMEQHDSARQSIHIATRTDRLVLDDFGLIQFYPIYLIILHSSVRPFA